MLISKQRSQVMAYKNGVLRTSVQLGPNLVRPAEQNWRLSQWSRTIDSKSITHIKHTYIILLSTNRIRTMDGRK